MPEGDSIFRSARTLQRALAGHVVTRFETAYAHLARIDARDRYERPEAVHDQGAHQEQQATANLPETGSVA